VCCDENTGEKEKKEEVVSKHLRVPRDGGYTGERKSSRGRRHILFKIVLNEDRRPAVTLKLPSNKKKGEGLYLFSGGRALWCRHAPTEPRAGKKRANKTIICSAL